MLHAMWNSVVPVLGRMLLALTIAAHLHLTAQQAFLDYTLRVDPADLSHVQISLELRNVPRVFHLAMATHFLTKQNYSRNIEDVQITNGILEHVEDPLWKVTVPTAEATIRYKVRLEQSGGLADAAKPFLAPTGGLLGDLPMFMYLVESPQAPAHVALQLPPEWKIATPLAPTSDEHIFYARNAEELTDSPILAGNLHESRFNVSGIPVRVAYWPLPDAKPFDEKTMVGDIEKTVRASAALFGGLPWREYVFQIRDGAEGALEHTNCVTLGITSQRLAANAHASQGQVAHEYFHAWNMMRIRSTEYHGIDHHPIKLSGLWFSEGATMFYADLLLRRSGLPVPTPTRLAHLENLIQPYLSLSGYARFSAEQMSLAAFDPERPLGGVGDYIGSPHVVGELLAAMLDVIIRDATAGQRSVDDLMRAMLAQYSGEHGFTGKDVERLAGSVCGCNVTAFFDSYVRGAAHIDFNRYLQFLGLRMEVTWLKSMPDGTALDDRFPFAWMAPGETAPRLQLITGSGAWGRAGVHTGDQLLKFNGSPVTSAASLEKLLEALHIGDTFRIEVRHDGTVKQAAVTVGSREFPVVKIRELPNATDRQRALFATWSKGE
jgi:predicted metalloprotease with PDZ domain